jgi:predicted ribosomally synthesized peptide with SipW-like signal peptide
MNAIPIIVSFVAGLLVGGTLAYLYANKVITQTVNAIHDLHLEYTKVLETLKAKVDKVL